MLGIPYQLRDLEVDTGSPTFKIGYVMKEKEMKGKFIQLNTIVIQYTDV